MKRSIALSAAILIVVAVIAPLIGSSHIELGARVRGQFRRITKFSFMRDCRVSFSLYWAGRRYR